MFQPVALLSLSTASPPFRLLQTEVQAAARKVLLESFPSFDRLAPVFTTSGIRERQAVRPIGWYQRSRGWEERAQTYLEGGVSLFVDCAAKALDEAGLKGSQVDIIVTVSSTGIATPSLEAQAMAKMGFRSDVTRVPVFGLGCAGGVSGLGLAARLAAATPGAIVLLVVVELCTLAFRTDDLTKADIVATALFGDGAAACVLKAGGTGFTNVTASAQHTWPDTLDIMGWRVEATGLGVIFARSIPEFVQGSLREAMVSMLQRGPVAFDDVTRFICHPGGAKVIEALERALSIDQGRLDHERDVLSDHGNMSAPTALFVLDRVRRHAMPDRSVLAALGPGFTASTVTLQLAA